MVDEKAHLRIRLGRRHITASDIQLGRQSVEMSVKEN